MLGRARERTQVGASLLIHAVSRDAYARGRVRSWLEDSLPGTVPLGELLGVKSANGNFQKNAYTRPLTVIASG